MAEGEQFASVLVSDLHRSNEETLRLRARITELEAEVKGLKEYAAERNGWATELTLLRDEHLGRIAELEAFLKMLLYSQNAHLIGYAIAEEAETLLGKGKG